jgi:hypothetical protein
MFKHTDLLESNIKFSNAAIIMIGGKCPKSMDGITDRIKWLAILNDRFGSDWTPDVARREFSHANDGSSVFVKHEMAYLNNPPAHEQTVTPEQLIDLLAEYRLNELALQVREAWSKVKSLKPAWSVKPLQRESDAMRNALVEVLEKAPKDQPPPTGAAILAIWRSSTELPDEFIKISESEVHFYNRQGAVAFAGSKNINDRIKSMIIGI